MSLINKGPWAAVLLLSISISSPGYAQEINLSDKDAEWIGDKIFRNECAGKDERLISWNDGEDFMSLGIGHFIWYPKDKIGPFAESFPDLVGFIRESGRDIPEWLNTGKDLRCPWQSKEEFLLDLQSDNIRELRDFLVRTKDLQLLFILSRLKTALPKILDAAGKEEKGNIERQFYRMASTPAGIYALVDYVNLKGEGILSTERYKGYGWGLLQVLEDMEGAGDGRGAVFEFVEAAGKVLDKRVENSPSERNEKRWLSGWKRRLGTYIAAITENER